MGLFDGKVAIVTGAGRGIGRSEAVMLAAEGASVVVNDLGGSGAGDGSDARPAQQVVDDIVAAGGRAVANTDDCATWSGAERLVQQAVETFGALDVLVCNAGNLRDAPVSVMTEDDFDAVLRVHVKGHFAPIRFATAHWKAQSKASGRPSSAAIVTTTSESGLYGHVNHVNYASAKGAIASMTIAVARELKATGIRINAVAPVAATRLMELGTGNDFSGDPMLSPDVPAAGAAWLASPLAEGINGQVLKIGGGIAQILDGWRPTTQVSTSEPWTVAALAERRPLLFHDRDAGVPPFWVMEPFADTVA
jgi:NAD(P)-dependent dehydrogenase (short-subunit alcohol dehydrogenase family)